MSHVKIILKRNTAHSIFALIHEIMHTEPCIDIEEKLVMSEIMEMINEKHNKEIIKFKLFYSQSFIIFRILSCFNQYPDVVEFLIHIEEQLFRQSEVGFQILKEQI